MGTSAVLSGTLLFGITGTAEASPAAAPATVSTAVVLTSSTTVMPTTVSPTWDWDNNSRKHRYCHRIWHKSSWFWWGHKRSWKHGWWQNSCRWRWYR